jgi:tetratricopeptide (TPR) repeat protein
VSADAPTEAIPVLEEALARQPDNGFAHFVIAAALLDARRDIDSVIAHARRAVFLRPFDPGALVLLSRVLAIDGQLEEAAVIVERALTIRPDDPDGGDLRRRISMATAGTAPRVVDP